MSALAWFCGMSAAHAAPQSDAEAAPTSGAQAATTNGNFFSSLKQAFKQDLDHEVVRGHFDLGTPPDTRRYYCLIDPKTGRREVNGVGGEPVIRKDGMTGIKSGAVSFYSCANAEQSGTLVTTGYVLTAGATAALAKVPPPPLPPAAAPAPTTVAPDGAVQTDVMAAFTRFIAGQNAHDRTAVSDVLLDSKDFAWTMKGGASLWGRQEAMLAFERAWKGTWKLDPQLNEMHIGSIAPDAAVLITPVLVTEGPAGAAPTTALLHWGGVFVKTVSGWRIASIFVTPIAGETLHN